MGTSWYLTVCAGIGLNVQTFLVKIERRRGGQLAPESHRSAGASVRIAA
jgi:hypothetical protein